MGDALAAIPQRHEPRPAKAVASSAVVYQKRGRSMLRLTCVVAATTAVATAVVVATI